MNSVGFVFKRCCNDILLKIAKNWRAFLSATRCGNEILGSSISFQKLSKMSSINLAYVVSKLEEVWNTDFIENVAK